MDGTTIAAFAAATAALVAFALAAFMFWKGKWLFLVAGGAAAVEEAESAVGSAAGLSDAGGVRKMGRRMAVVLLAACVLVATLLAFEGAKLAGNALLASAATLVNNVAFVALLVAMVWFFIVQRPDRPKESTSSQDPRMASRAHAARLDHLPLATILFTLAIIAVVALVGILFAGL
ncbi:hypothetical protein [Gordonibacter urolithinfaciens]|uniref:hypothetical protein n=1 Tax=Gordonibacter urolithinfaciens TaxID=1335613 RepID=UPI0013A686B0|nr:hypothetical protein [Gordonibacter urolithinfaciens]